MRFKCVKDGIDPEPGIGTHPQLTDIGRNIGKADIEQLGAAVPGSGVTGAEFGIPEVGGVGLHAQHRIIGTLATMAWVVADFRPVLMAEDCDHGAVEIEDQARTVVR